VDNIKQRKKKSFDFKNIDLDLKIAEMLTFAQDYDKPTKKIESDQRTYKIYLQFFKSITKFTIEDIIVGMSLSYSWMPTILTINFDLIKENESKILGIFQGVKRGGLVNNEQLELLQKIINNSVVGTSKLLHFINPEQYPIIDSRVSEFLFGSSTDKLSSPDFYLEYMQFVKEKLIEHKDSEEIFNVLKRTISNDISKIRAIEFCMYGIAVERSEIKKKETKEAKKAS
jgi:hypothetical protein